MRILGIETSCDETGIALLDISERAAPAVRVVSNAIASQVETHRQYGGVYPMVAKREHQRNLPIVLATSMRGHEWKSVDALAVIVGPGLSPCLWAGITFAEHLAKEHGLFVIPADHIEGHILSALLSQSGTKSQHEPKYTLQTNVFPAVALIVSGGHTQLILVKGIGKYELLGETRDDAAGECFDKTARILGLPYPGGPAIAQQAKLARNIASREALGGRLARSPNDSEEQTAESATPERPQERERGDSRKQYFEQYGIRLPRPMEHAKNYDFSFSGLKTAVLYDYKSRAEKERTSLQYIQEMAFCIQQAICDVLIKKTLKAARSYGARSVILGGGVAANEALRQRLAEALVKEKIGFLAPPPALCTDNGIMAALAGFTRQRRTPKRKFSGDLEALPDMRIE